MGLSLIGIDNLKNKIQNHTVEVPEARTLQELQGWMNGYAKCQEDILDIIDDFYNGMEQRG